MRLRPVVLVLVAAVVLAADPRSPVGPTDPVLLVPEAVLMAEIDEDIPRPGSAGVAATLRIPIRILDAVMPMGPEGIIFADAAADADLAAPAADGRAALAVVAIAGHDLRKARVSLRAVRGIVYDTDAKRGIRFEDDPAAPAIRRGRRVWIRIIPVEPEPPGAPAAAR